MRCSFRVLAAFAISLAAGAAFAAEASRGDEAVKNSCSQAAFSLSISALQFEGLTRARLAPVSRLASCRASPRIAPHLPAYPPD
jgi:hypothetical protein